MVCNISFTIHVNPSCNQERKFIKPIKSHKNVTSNQGMQRSTNKEYFDFLHTYCDEDHVRYLADRRSVTLAVHTFNGTLIDFCAKKQSETSRTSSNLETRAIYTGVLDQNCIIKFFRLICYTILPP